LTSSGEEVFFKIKRNTKLSKLQAAYANKVGKDVGTIRYVHESRLNHRSLAIHFWNGGLIVFFPLRSPLDRPWACHLGVGRFLYDGNRINDDDTPASLDMEDNGQSTPRPPRLPPFLAPASFLLRRADSNSVDGHTDTIDVMVERPWFCPSASLVRRLLTHGSQQRLEDVDKLLPRLHFARQPPCYRCTYALLSYHSSLSSVQPAITPTTLVATQLWPMQRAIIYFSRSVDRISPNRSDYLWLYGRNRY
jgi:hypothetical protein